MAVVRATIEEPYIGSWVIDADLLADDEFDPAAIVIGNVTWSGQLVSSRVEGAIRKVRVVGGTASLGQTIPDQSFVDSEYSSVLSRVLLNTGFVGAIVEGSLPLYCLLSGPLGLVLGKLTRTLGLFWWVERNGTIQIGAREATDAVGDRIATDIDASVYLSCESCTAVLPGQVYEGRAIRHVRWRLTPERLLAELSFEDFPRTEPSLGYELTYAGKIVRQDSENPIVDVLVRGTLGIPAVPLMTGGPFRVQVAADDLCRVAFENADPRRPYVLVTGQRGAKRVAREGDTIDLGSLTFVDPGASGPEVLTWIPPPTEANPVPVPIVIGASPTPIYGVIDSGSDEVKIP